MRQNATKCDKMRQNDYQGAEQERTEAEP